MIVISFHFTEGVNEEEIGERIYNGNQDEHHKDEAINNDSKLKSEK